MKATRRDAAVGVVPASAAAIAAAGLVSLAVAMGIGRFAFTPVLPMMLKDVVIDIAGASWLASANYLGYLAGAVFCMLQPWLASRLRWVPDVGDATRWVRSGLAITAALTLGMALPLAAAWPTLRFAAGVASAITLINTSGWCFAQLATRGQPALGGLVFAGPGVGIVLGGAVAGGAIALGGSAAEGWLVLSVLAAILVGVVWPIFQPQHEHRPEHGFVDATADESSVARSPMRPSHAGAEIGMLTVAYGLAGFGYIVTATFLPVIARAALPGSPWIDWFWPIFGMGTALGAVAATRLRGDIDLRLMLAGAYAVQTLGIAIGLLAPTLAGFAIGSLLIGLPFTTITYLALREARRLRPTRAASTIGLLTTVYSLGQVAGPPMVSRLVQSAANESAGFDRSLEVAAAALAIGAACYLSSARLWPKRGRP